MNPSGALAYIELPDVQGLMNAHGARDREYGRSTEAIQGDLLAETFGGELVLEFGSDARSERVFAAIIAGMERAGFAHLGLEPDH